jgi:hypothetical protein
MVSLLLLGVRTGRLRAVESVQESIHHLSGVQQVADRADGTGLLARRRRRVAFGEAGGEIRPSGRDKGTRAVREHQCQMQNASAVCGATYGEKLSLQRMALSHDRDLRRQVMDAGSV